MKLRIVHITDIHLSRNNSSSFKNYYLSALLKDLEHFNKEKKIDIICLTGDLLDKGGASLKIDGNKYQYFINEFWRPIASLLELNDNRLFIVPGNHDIDESQIEEVIENGLVSTLQTFDQVNNFVEKSYSKEYLGSERQKEFKDFEKEFYKNEDFSYLSRFESCHVAEVNGVQVGVACLNTSWRCYTKQKADSLVMGTSQIAKASAFLKEKGCQLSIALMHHPVDFLSSIEKEEANIRLQTSEFDMVLFGHTHAGETVYKNGPNGNVFVSTARTGFSNPSETVGKYQSGYTIIDIDNLDVNCKYRKYVNAGNRFDIDSDSAIGGEFQANLLPRNGKEDYFKLVRLANDINKSKIEFINESLVIFGTDTKAPRNVDELFVLPRLTDSPPSYESFENPTHLTLQEILSYSENILIFGGKESGKTTLLNKIFIELSDFFSFYKKIPVKIDFLSIKTRAVRSLIKDFVGFISNTELDDLLRKGNALLLIDNIVSDDEEKEISYKLQEFISKWPNIKIIGTTDSHGNAFLEDETNCLSGFKNIYIGTVGAREFKSLATKWFDGQNQEWIKEHLEKLIKVFEKLRITRTFFSVSLFLWIIEKNLGYKPTNNHDLLSMFMKYILEGFNLSNTRAGSYNYNKKTELLTELALTMFNDGDASDNYSLRESKAVEVFQKNFSENQLRLQASEKLQELIDKGILKFNSVSGAIHFRFESFFQYFLSHNIEHDKKLFATITDENKFLLFIEEIDFYTAFKRTDKSMLNRAVDVLNKTFAELDAKYVEEHMDSYFPSASQLFKHVDANKAISHSKLMKLNNEEIEDVMGRQIDLLPVHDSITVKENLPDKDILSMSLEMAARVLKNSENIKDPKYVNQVLDLIITKSSKLIVYVQSILIDQIQKTPDTDNLPISVDVIKVFGPLVVQSILYKWLGTEFIELPLNNKINAYYKLEDKSELELFVATFLYADMQGKNYTDVIENSVNNMSNKFVLELCYIKILNYYTMKSERSAHIPVFEKIMARIITKVKGMPARTAKQFVENSLKSYRRDMKDTIIELD